MSWQELAKTHEYIVYTPIDRAHYLAFMPWYLAGVMILGAIGGFAMSKWAAR